MSKISSKISIGLHAKYPIFLSHFNQTSPLSTDVRKDPPISNFMKIRTLGAEIFHADRQTDRYDEANNRFSQFCESALKRLKIMCNLGDADWQSDSDSSICFSSLFGIHFFWSFPT